MRLLVIYFLLLCSCNNETKNTGSISTAPVIEQDTKPVITQSAKTLKPGDELEINVQLAPMNDTLNPKVRINEIDVPINRNGQVIYLMKAAAEYGTHTIPVRVVYTSKSGKIKADNYSVSYLIEK